MFYVGSDYKYFRNKQEQLKLNVVEKVQSGKRKIILGSSAAVKFLNSNVEGRSTSTNL